MMNESSGDIKPVLCSLMGGICQTGSSFSQSNNLKDINPSFQDTDVKPVLCNICGEAFQEEAILMNHKKIHHNMTEMAIEGDSDKKRFTSSLCSYTFHDQHADDNDDMKQHLCNVCDEVFQDNTALLDHQRVHIDEHVDGNACSSKETDENCVSEEEDKLYDYFNPKVATTRHARKRNKTKLKGICGEENVCTCDICGKGFPSKGELRSHKIWHCNSKKKFVCTTCGKVFPHRSNLVLHEHVHSKEKAHVCECGKAFSWKASLNNHYKMIHRNQSYCICHCGKGFSQKNAFESHKKECASAYDKRCSKKGKVEQVKKEPDETPKRRMFAQTKYGVKIEL